MKPGAIVLNVARGGIVDEAAVAEALRVRPPRRRRDRRLRARAADRLAAARRAEHAPDAAPRRVDGRGPGPRRPRRSPPRSSTSSTAGAPATRSTPRCSRPETARAIAPYLPLAEIARPVLRPVLARRRPTLTLEIAGELAEYDGDAADRGRPARPARDRRPPSGSTSSTPAPSPRRAGSPSSSARRPTPARSPPCSRCRARRTARTDGRGRARSPAASRGSPGSTTTGWTWRRPTTMLITRHMDRPGTVGRIGLMLGEADVNISAMHLARTRPREDALMILALDDDVPDAVVEAIRDARGGPRPLDDPARGRALSGRRPLARSPTASTRRSSSSATASRRSSPRAASRARRTRR